LTVANRIIQLDHQTRGRVMFGVGPGLLPSDAFQLGIDPNTQRDRMVESIEVILKLFAGERVTKKTEWFTLSNAIAQLKPYTWPHPEICVASSVTPSGGKLAGKHGFGMLCVAATQTGGYDALGINWKIANEVAAENGRKMDSERLRLVGTAKEKAAILSFVVEGIHPHDLGTVLDTEGVAIRTGHHCTQPVMKFFGVPATSRASLTFYNTTEEIDILVKALHKVRDIFKD
jgi:hypothetical protein